MRAWGKNQKFSYTTGFHWNWLRWYLNKMFFFYYKMRLLFVRKCDSSFVTKCDKFFVTKYDRFFYYKVRQVHYNMRQVLQSATGITKVRRLFVIITKCDIYALKVLSSYSNHSPYKSSFTFELRLRSNLRWLFNVFH